MSAAMQPPPPSAPAAARRNPLQPDIKPLFVLLAAVLEATLTNLRTKLTELESDK